MKGSLITEITKEEVKLNRMEKYGVTTTIYYYKKTIPIHLLNYNK